MSKDSKQEGVEPSAGESSAENQPILEDDPLKKQEDEENLLLKEKQELIERLRKAEKKASDFEKAFYKEKARRREEFYNPPAHSQLSDDSQNDDWSKEIEAIVDKRLQKEKAENQKKNLKIAFDRFCASHPEYLPENDSYDFNYNRLRERANRTFLGDSVEEIIESLEFIHRGLKNESPTSPETQPEKVDDSGVGSSSGLQKGIEKKPDALTRPLTKWEQEAALRFPGGEEAYRKKLLERESE